MIVIEMERRRFKENYSWYEKVQGRILMLKTHLLTSPSGSMWAIT